MGKWLMSFCPDDGGRRKKKFTKKQSYPPLGVTLRPKHGLPTMLHRRN
jgi:hypothetical protein